MTLTFAYIVKYHGAKMQLGITFRHLSNINNMHVISRKLWAIIKWYLGLVSQKCGFQKQFSTIRVK